jgi:hypothetical protein
MALKKVSSSRDSRGILANASNACIGGLSVGADATANLDGSGNAVTVNGPIAGTVNNIANLNADPAWLCTRLTADQVVKSFDTLTGGTTATQ